MKPHSTYSNNIEQTNKLLVNSLYLLISSTARSILLSHLTSFTLYFLAWHCYYAECLLMQQLLKKKKTSVDTIRRQLLLILFPFFSLLFGHYNPLNNILNALSLFPCWEKFFSISIKIRTPLLSLELSVHCNTFCIL